MVQKNRIHEIDIIRGFALFGVLLVNLTMIDATLYGNSRTPFAIELFAQGKFYTIFAFLFGLGFHFFSKGNFAFKRRLWVLLIFGILHLVLVWYGDILHLYAITGFILIKSHHYSDKKLKRRVIGLFILSLMMYGFFAVDVPESSVFVEQIHQGEVVLSTGTYGQVILYRLTHEIPIVFVNLFFTLPKILLLFYLGVLVGRHGFFETIESQRPLIVKWNYMSGGLFGILIFGIFIFNTANRPVIEALLQELSTYVGSFFYLTTLIRFSQTKGIRWLENAGKMALTNYLTQTIFWTLFFYGYGGGWFGEVSPKFYFPAAVIFFYGQVVFSTWWIHKFKTGPMERLWRRLYA